MAFNPGQVIAGYVEPARLRPDILRMATDYLELHMNGFQSVIAVTGKNYLALGSDGQAFMAFHMGRLMNKTVMWAKDGTPSKSDRWLLGPCEKFIAGSHMIVSINGIAVVVRRPPHQFLEDARGSEAAIHFSESPEPQCKVKIPRPPNNYILYRKDHHAQVKQLNSHLTNNEVSVILGKAWNNESHAVRERYTELARIYKEQLMMVHPDYRYAPRKPSEKRRRSRSEKTKSQGGKAKVAVE